MRVVVTDAPFEPLDELKRFEERNHACGAIASFVGRCRPRSHGAAVVSLELQHYPGFTEREIERAATSIAASTGVRDVLVIHRVGSIAPGEAIVLVAAASNHRAAALAAAETLIDFLKTDAPFWKREITDAGERWIEPTPLDYQRRRAKAQSA